MTPSYLPSGTDRIFEASKRLEASKNIKADIVVNIQGDEPLIRGDVLDLVVKPLIADASIEMATLGSPLTSLEALTSSNTAKIVLNEKNEALYFSRFPIPFSREKMNQELNSSKKPCVLKHIGIYAYRRDFLKRF
jgi:3-deoxy-manno-octulosonate cytidylyltransferase (CMP-KDO synthetase)